MSGFLRLSILALLAATCDGRCAAGGPFVALFQPGDFRGAQPPRPAPIAVSPDMVREGSALFHRDWLTRGPLAGRDGDGLGPMFNARSCVACHRDGAAGGAGDATHNVDLLTIEATPAARKSSGFEIRAMNVHPEFREDVATVVLHRQMIDIPGRPDPRYDAWRAKLLGADGRRPIDRDHPRGEIAGMKVRLTQRNTPALFGAGLIDALPDHVLIAVADEERAEHRDTAGRVARSSSGRVGRFGWRGQTARLHEFVLGACANELGLEVPGHAQPPRIVPEGEGNPYGTTYIARDRPNAFNLLDLTDEQCKSLTAFVAGLRPPERASAVSLTQSREVSSGEELFAEIGCAECHRRQLGPIDGIYSDLLLHDMGPELADPAAAFPEFNEDSAPTPHTGSYFGGPVEEPRIALVRGGAKSSPPVEREWRTPPLWGVADSAPYLHDGRAETLGEAIRLHGGQGRRSARQFFALNLRDRERVTAFLNSLVAPTSGSPAAETTIGIELGSGQSTR